MFEFRWTSPPVAAIATPCIGVCELGDDGLCTGCFRSGDEIAAWSAMSPAQREALMTEELPQRESTRR